MVSVCLPSDAVLQHLPSYLGFSYLGRGVSLHGCSSKVQPLLLTLDKRYLLTAALPDVQHGIAPLGPPEPAQPPLLGCGFAPPSHHNPAISSSVIPFSSCPQSLPASGSFPVSQLITCGGQSIEVSASTSVLPMNTQDLSPLGWTGWISLQSKGLSRVFSNTTVQKH